MRVLIVANGEAPSKLFLQKKIEEADYVISADSASVFLKYDLNADCLIGDMDSSKEDAEILASRCGARLIKAKCEKDETDTLLALNEAIRIGATEVAILGGFGSRMDHVYANIMLLLYSCKKGIKATLENEENYVCVANGKHTIKGKAGDTVSLLPFMGKATVHAESGFQYQLQNLTLKEDFPIGISNILTKDAPQITIEGYALVIVTKEK